MDSPGAYKLVVLAAVLIHVAAPARAAADAPSFAVQIAGALQQYRSEGGGPVRISDDDVEATVDRVGGDEWELSLRVKNSPGTAIWFPWEAEKETLGPRLDAAVVYYPRLLGVVVRASLLREWGWQGGAYPGECFAPLVVVGDQKEARLVAASNWPPRRVFPMYSLGRVGLRYDDPLPVGATRSYRAIVARAPASVDEPPWQRALDIYKGWVRARVEDAGLRPAPPEWLRAAHGWLNVQLQNAAIWDPGDVERIWKRWKRELPWVQFWGQMSDHYVRGPTRARTGCCLDDPKVHPRYEPGLARLARSIASDGKVGFYVRPRSPYLPLFEDGGTRATPELGFLRAWVEANRSQLGANALYIDVLGHRDFGDPIAVARMLQGDFGSATVIEYPVDVYPAAFLVSGSLGGGTWSGGPTRTLEHLGGNLTRTTFPAFGRYLLDDRVLFAGESNGDGRWWGAKEDYWTERQAFLLGAKFDVMHPTEDGRPDGAPNRALMAAILAREGSGWWSRKPVYLHRRGIGALPVDVDVRRYRGSDNETLLAVDNWHERRDLSVELDGKRIPLPSSPLAIVVLPRTA